MSRLSFIMIIKITLCLKFLWQQRVRQLLRNGKKKNNRIYSHLNFFLSHSFPTVCSPHPFVRICGLPSLCSGLFPPQCVSLASWFQNNHCDFKFPHLPWTFVYTLSMFGQNVLFCLFFFFPFWEYPTATTIWNTSHETNKTVCGRWQENILQ